MDIKKILANPILNVVNLFLAIIGLVIATIFYFENKREPELTFMTSPIRTKVALAGQASTLRIMHDKRQITKDVIAVQVAIWNAGRKAVRRADFLEPLEIYTDPPVEILEATVRRQSRPTINFRLSEEHLELGVVPLAWTILERNDGASVQIVYEGSEDVAIKVRGTVEGQRTINVIETNTWNKNWFGFDQPRVRIIVTGTMLVMAVFLLVISIRRNLRRMRRRHSRALQQLTWLSEAHDNSLKHLKRLNRMLDYLSKTFTDKDDQTTLEERRLELQTEEDGIRGRMKTTAERKEELRQQMRRDYRWQAGNVGAMLLVIAIYGIVFLQLAFEEAPPFGF